MIHMIVKIKVTYLKFQARRLYAANQAELDAADCGFAIRDALSGGRLSRRVARINAIIAKIDAMSA